MKCLKIITLKYIIVFISLNNVYFWHPQYRKCVILSLYILLFKGVIKKWTYFSENKYINSPNDLICLRTFCFIK